MENVKNNNHDKELNKKLDKKENKNSNKKRNYYKMYKELKDYISISSVGLLALGMYALSSLDEAKAEKTQSNEIQSEYALQNDIEPIDDLLAEALKETAPKYSASYIMNDYLNNDTYEGQKALEKKYVDKYLEITGIINEPQANYIDGYYFTYKNDKPKNDVAEWGRIYCYLYDEEDRSLIKNMEKGDEVTVVGYCNSDILFMDVVDCDILKINGDSITR